MRWDSESFLCVDSQMNKTTQARMIALVLCLPLSLPAKVLLPLAPVALLCLPMGVTQRRTHFPAFLVENAAGDVFMFSTCKSHGCLTR